MPTIIPLTSSVSQSAEALQYVADLPTEPQINLEPQFDEVAQDQFEASANRAPQLVVTVSEPAETIVLPSKPAEHSAWMGGKSFRETEELLKDKPIGTWALRSSSLNQFDDEELGIHYFVYCKRGDDGDVAQSRLAWVAGDLYNLTDDEPPKPDYSKRLGTLADFARPEMMLVMK